MKPLPIALACFAVSVFGIGCSTVGYQRALNTSWSIEDSAKSIDRSIPRIGAVSMTLDALSNAPRSEYKSRYATYRFAVANLESFIYALNRDAETMIARGSAYFRNWDLKLQENHTGESSEIIRNHMEDLEKRFAYAKDRHALSALDSAALISNAISIRDALESDLTRQGIEEQRERRAQVSRAIDNLVTQLEALSAHCKSLAIDIAQPPTS